MSSVPIALSQTARTFLDPTRCALSHLAPRLDKDGMSHWPSAFPVRATVFGAVRSILARAVDPPLGNVKTKSHWTFALLESESSK